MKNNLPTINKNTKLALNKTKKLFDITNSILSKNKNTIHTYLEEESSIYIDDLDANDYKIVKNLIENRISLLFELLEKEEINLWIKNLTKCTSNNDVNSLVGECIMLAFCKYSLLSLPSDTEEVLLRKVSKELKNIIYTINNL